ncbi:MAG: hypothetical protein SPF40_04495, partial [Prevotella sp.]|nr:hypothetical protein [Prevotella sp.]
QPQQTATPADTARVEPKDTANATNSQSQSQASAPTGAAASIGSSISGVMQPETKPTANTVEQKSGVVNELTPANEGFYTTTLTEKDSTWEVVAERFHVSVENLQKLNKGVTPKKGIKVRIKEKK